MPRPLLLIFLEATSKYDSQWFLLINPSTYSWYATLREIFSITFKVHMQIQACKIKNFWCLCFLRWFPNIYFFCFIFNTNGFCYNRNAGAYLPTRIRGSTWALLNATRFFNAFSKPSEVVGVFFLRDPEIQKIAMVNLH